MERDVEVTPESKPPFTVGVEVAFQYTDSSSVTELAFANTINTPDGGTHLTGLRSAVTSVLNRYARKAGFIKEKESNLSGSDTLEGITAIVSVKHPDPQFESQTKVKLMNSELQGVVSQVVTEAFNEFLEVNPREARKIIDKCMTSKRAREAARKARDLVRSGPSLLESTTLPGKLADCSSHDQNAELYIVEGDSAGGTAKQGRDRHFQAILPLRGKILNTERARLHKILDNNEVKSLVTALGTGIGDDFDIKRLRYGRVIVMTDADVDGSHIRTLLLTFFFRHMLPLTLRNRPSFNFPVGSKWSTSTTKLA
jgi:DNA gyrase subunit B